MTSTTTRKRIITASSIGALGVAAFLVASAVVPATANFNATKNVHVGVNTASISFDQSAPIDLEFNNLQPQQDIQETFTLANTGSIDGEVNLSDNVSGFVSNTDLSGLDLGQLRVGAWQQWNDQPLTAVNALPAGGWDLGVLHAGETKTYVVSVKLGGTADNSWENVKIGGDLTATLTSIEPRQGA